MGEDLQESQNENEEIEIKVQVLEKEEDRFSAIEEKEEIVDEKMESIIPGEKDEESAKISESDIKGQKEECIDKEEIKEIISEHSASEGLKKEESQRRKGEIGKGKRKKRKRKR